MIIPRRKSRNRLQPRSPVSIGSSASARIDGETLANFGNTLAKVGKRQLERERFNTQSRKQSEISSALSTNFQNSKRDALSDGSDLKERFNKSSEKDISRILNDVSDPVVRKKLETFTQNARTKLSGRVDLAAVAMKEEHNLARAEENINLDADSIRSNPSEEFLSLTWQTKVNDTQSMIESGAVSREGGIKEKNVAREVFAEAYVDGLIQKEQYGKALNFLEANKAEGIEDEISTDRALNLGLINEAEKSRLDSKGQKFKAPLLGKKDRVQLTPELSELAKGISPSKKASLTERLKNRIKSKNQVRLSDLNSQISGMGQLAFTGTNFNRKQINDLRTQINATDIPSKAKARLHDKVNSYVIVNEQVKRAKDLNINQWPSLAENFESRAAQRALDDFPNSPGMKGINNDFAVQGNRKRIKNQLRSALLNLRKQAENDPVAFYADSPEMKKYIGRAKDGDTSATKTKIDVMMDFQKSMGISKPKPLANREVLQVVSRLKAGQNSEDITRSLNTLEAEYSTNTREVLMQAAEFEEGLYEYAAVIDKDPHGRESLVDTIRNRKEIDDAFKSDETLSGMNDTIKVKVQEKMADFNRSVVTSVDGANNLGVSNATRRLIETESKKLMTTNGLEAEEAVERATNNVINSTYHIAKSGGSSLLVPRQELGVGRDPTIVDAYIKTYSRPEKLKQLNIRIPKQFTGERTQQGGEFLGGLAKPASSDARENRFLNDLANNHKWVTNNSKSGAMLLYKDTDGNFKNVYKKDGEPVEVSYQDMLYTDDEDVLEEKAGFFGSLFGVD